MTSSQAEIMVRLMPRAGRDQIDGWYDGVLRVRVIAPPVDGRANEALVRTMARTVGVAPTAIAIVSGRTSKLKRLRISGLTQPELAARLERPIK